jgi:hypothetical protein
LKTNTKRWFILDFPILKEALMELYDQSAEHASNRFLLSTLLDFATAEKDN